MSFLPYYIVGALAVLVLIAEHRRTPRVALPDRARRIAPGAEYCPNCETRVPVNVFGTCSVCSGATCEFAAEERAVELDGRFLASVRLEPVEALRSAAGLEAAGERAR